MTGTYNPHQTALEYAAKGWRVVPITPGKKWPPLASWQRLATTDTALINRWWMGDYQSYGVGIATGAASGIWVLDIDDRDALYELEREHGELPPTLTSITGSGGEHQFFAYPADGRIITNSASSVLDGIDVRGEGGQVVAPPSVHPNGNQYEWDEQCNTIAVAPEWLLELVCDKHNQPAPTPAVSSGHEISYPVGDMVLTMDSERTPIGDQLLAAMGIGTEPAPVTTAAPAPGLIDIKHTDTPGDLYAAANDWHQILTPDGWQLHHTDRNGERYWVRPGKQLGDGIGATTGNTANDNMHVFTSSMPHLKAEETYTKLGYYAATHHSGDHSAAAKQLAADGYRTDPTTSPHSGELVSTAADGDTRETQSLLEQMRINWDDFWNTDHSEENWLLEPLIAKGRNHSITAAAKQGKSLITLAALAPASLGHPVLGRPAGTPLRTLYLDYEMSAADVQERLSDMGFDQGFTPEAFAYLLHPPLSPLDTQAGGIQVHELATQHHADLVVIDTYSRAIEGADDSTDTVKALYRHTITPLLAKGIAVLRLDHTGHKSTQRARGSSGKADDIDVGWMLTKTEGGIKLTSTHARMQWVPETVNLKLCADPLKLELVQGGWPHGTKDAANKLSAAGVIPGDSQRTAREKLKTAGGKLSSELLRAGLRYLPEMFNLIAGQTESAPE